MSSGDVRALTFDVFGTLVNWRDSIARETQAALKPRGVALDWHDFADRWRARYQPAMEAVRSGQRPWTKLDVLHRENLDSLLAELGIQGLTEAEVDHLNRAWHRLDPWPDTVAGMQGLRQRYVLAALSNGNVALGVNLARHASLPWDAILGAEVARAYKPTPQAYLSAADMLGVAPEHCMMVAAHNNDLVAASRQGLRTAFIRRPTEHGPGQTRDLKPSQSYDFVADSLTDLASQLGC